MGVDSFSRQAVKALRRLSRAEHISVVVGAGASVAADLPDWSSLLKRLLARPGLPEDTRDRLADALLQTQGSLLGAEAAFDEDVDGTERKRLIAEALFSGRKRSDFEPTALHFAIVELALERGPDKIQLFTTNYDDLLEEAFKIYGLVCQSRYDHHDRSKRGSFTVHHLHGFLGRQRIGRRYAESPDLVLTQSDYDRLYLQQNDWPGEALGQAAARGPLLFIGTSLTDPNLVRYLQRIRHRQLAEHLQVLARQGLRIPQDLFPHFSERLTTQWKKSRVELALLEDYADITSYVLELARCGVHGYSPPARRLRQFWGQLNRTFRRNQEDLSRELDRQFRCYLQPLLGREAALGLWIADGQGSLVRFAANDRIYRSPNVLRRIPYCWDTGWAVTESVSFGNRVLRPIPPHDIAGRVPDQRWRYEAAVPLWIGGDGHPPLIAGALSSNTVQLKGTGKDWLDTLKDLAFEWGVFLTDLVS